MPLIRCLNSLHEILESVVLVNAHIPTYSNGLLLPAVALIGLWVVVPHLLDAGLQYYHVLDALAIVKNISLVDECMRIDKKELLLRIWVNTKHRMLMLCAGLKTTRHVVSQMHLFDLVADPSLSGLAQLALPQHAALPLLNLHYII